MSFSMRFNSNGRVELVAILLLHLIYSSAAADIPPEPLYESDCIALMAFPAASQAMGLTSCNKTIDCGLLKGVDCNAEGRVIEIELQSSGIGGTLPRQWSSLMFLARLNLASNKIEGTLPPEWGEELKYLFSLRLSSNKITGSLPPEWGGMESLMELELARNKIQGPLPPEWGRLSALTRLDAQHNAISGTLPRQWGAMTSMRVMALDFNKLKGEIPDEWTNMSPIPGLSNGISFFDNDVMWERKGPQFFVEMYCNLYARNPSNEYYGNRAAFVQFCDFGISNRRWTAAGFLWGFSVMLMAVAAVRAWLPAKPANAADSTAPSLIARLVQWVLPALLLLANIASDIWVLLKIMPRNSADYLWWPYGLLLTAIILPHIISSVIAWIRWHRKAPPTTNMAACIAWWTLSFVPFCLVLHLGLVYRALTAPFRRGDGKPVELAVRSRWHLHPAAVVAAVDPPSYPKLLDCVVGVTQDPLSIIAVTAFFLSKKKVASKAMFIASHTLGSGPYLVCVLLSAVHILRVEWVLLSHVKAGHGWKTLLSGHGTVSLQEAAEHIEYKAVPGWGQKQVDTIVAGQVV